jgi:hypothetical protein
MKRNRGTKGNRMLSESLLAEVKCLIATRLGLDEDSIDVGVTVSVKEHDAAVRRLTKCHTISESRSWGYGTSTSTTTTSEDD